MSNQADHTIVRLRVPPELKQKIEESAEKNNRSQSAEMVARLEQSFEKDDAAEFDKEFVLQVIKSQESTITDLTDQIKHLKMSFDILSEALREKKTP